MDIMYLENWSLGLDRIMLRTAPAVSVEKGL